jgi:hypothetical protein
MHSLARGGHSPTRPCNACWVARVSAMEEGGNKCNCVFQCCSWSASGLPCMASLLARPALWVCLFLSAFSFFFPLVLGGLQTKTNKQKKSGACRPPQPAPPHPLLWPPREAGLGSEIGAICRGRSPSNGAILALQACSAEPAAPGLCCGESTGHAIYKCTRCCWLPSRPSKIY